MATFNGEEYLNEQIESLLSQDYENFGILIRDDGSSDSTIRRLKHYEKNKRIEVIFGENLGVTQCFFELMRESDPLADYFSFCDQDDVWLPNKLTLAVDKLQAIDPVIPAMYFSRLHVVDEQLNKIKLSFHPRRAIGIENAIVQNVATGCTIVLNKTIGCYTNSI